MPRPKKIKKKKSFMFSARHHSQTGILSILLAIASLTTLIASVIVSFLNRGDTPARLGSAGMFAVLANVLGLVAGVISSRERDIYTWVPKAAVIMNAAFIFFWIFLVVAGIRGV